MSDFVEVQGYPGLVRDQKTNAILNVDLDKIERARAAKKLRLEKRQVETTLNNRLSSLESDMLEIKNALELITKKLI
jgi:hypothetical protein